MRASKIFSAHICPWFGKKHTLILGGGEAAVLALLVETLMDSQDYAAGVAVPSKP